MALDALREVKMASEVASRYKLHPTQIRQWKSQLVRRAPELFERGGGGGPVDEPALKAPPYEQIGRLQIEVEFLGRSS